MTRTWLVVLLICIALPVLRSPLAAATASENTFTQRSCARCHGLNERIRDSGAPAVVDMDVNGSMLDFGGRLWNHGPAMVGKAEAMKFSMPHLESKDIASLLSFITSYRHYNKDRSAVGDPARGEITWKGLKCAACHSLEADQQKRGASLGAYKNVSPVQMVQAMWKHSPDMSKAMTENGIKVPHLTGAQMVDILAYIRLKTGATQNVIYAELGDPTRGADVFKKKQCVKCHPVVESATQFGPQLQRTQEFMEGTAGIAALMWNHSVGMRDQMVRAGLTIPTFEGSEMADMLAYLYLSTYSEEKGNPAAGKKLFELKQCGLCHQPGKALAKTPQNGTRTALGIVAAMWNHVPEMSGQKDAGPSFPIIRPGEMKDLVAYVETIP